MNILRHGDLLLYQINEFPENLEKLNHTVLAEGEVTGHRHLLVKEREDTELELFKDKDGRLYFKTDGAKLTHQEHNTITIQPGIYFVKNEREFDPFADEIRRTRD